MSTISRASSSSSSNPDLDWSQVRETINMLTLAVSQIECTMTDGEKSVAELTQSFTYIASKLQEIVEQSSDTDLKSGNQKENAEGEQSLSISAQDIHQRVVNAIISFQFYDRLSQRLDHVKRDLSWLSSLVSNPQELYNPNAWHKLQEDIMSNYTMEEERLMFQHIMNGASVEEALEVYHHHFNKEKDADDQSGDEIDLF